MPIRILWILPAALMLVIALNHCSALKSRWYYEPEEPGRAHAAGDYPAAVLKEGSARILVVAAGSRFETRRYGPCILPLFGTSSPPEFRRKLNLTIIVQVPPKSAPPRMEPGAFQVRAGEKTFTPDSFQILDDGGRAPSHTWSAVYYNRKAFSFGPGRIRLFYEMDTASTRRFQLIVPGPGPRERTTVDFTIDRDWKYIPFTLKPLRAAGGGGIAR